MIDRYRITFARLKKERRIGFCPFAVLGDPTPKKCLVRIKKYLESVPDFLELGIPFSDPIADGPTIQAADERAIAAGTTPRRAMRLIKKIRAMAKNLGYETPIGILVYSNIVLRYGIAKFYRDTKNAGADSILIADAPMEEIKPFAAVAKKNHICQIFIVSEYTDVSRLRKIEKIGSGFLYVVAAVGVTGARRNLEKKISELIHKFKQQTRLPLLVGFGISSREHIKTLESAGAHGAIVGSLLVKTPTQNLSRILNELTQASVTASRRFVSNYPR